MLSLFPHSLPISHQPSLCNPPWLPCFARWQLASMLGATLPRHRPGRRHRVTPGLRPSAGRAVQRFMMGVFFSCWCKIGRERVGMNPVGSLKGNHQLDGLGSFHFSFPAEHQQVLFRAPKCPPKWKELVLKGLPFKPFKRTQQGVFQKEAHLY